MIAVVDFPGAGTLEPGDLFRGLVIRRPLEMALVRTGGAQNALKLHTGDHIGILGVLVGLVAGRIIGHEPGRKDDGSHVQMDLLLFLFEIDRFCGAELLAGAALSFFKEDAVVFVDRVLEGHCLGILDVDRFAFDQVFVEGVVHLLGALLCAGPAGDTLFHVHVAGALDHLHGKVSRFAAHVRDFRKGQELDVEMPADLDQFGRDNSHGAVIGGEGLVQRRHGPADGGSLFQQIDVIAGVGEVQSGLHAGDPAAYDQNRSIYPVRHKSPLCCTRPHPEKRCLYRNYIVATLQLQNGGHFSTPVASPQGSENPLAPFSRCLVESPLCGVRRGRDLTERTIRNSLAL